ncbi:MAG: ABC transporter permease [Longimicrobiales bacterium]
MKDIRYALRSLGRSPGFAAIAVLTLALGIGANSAIFSVLNGVILRPLPYASPERLVAVSSRFPSLGFEKFWISPPEYLELGERSRTLASLGGYRTGTVSVGGMTSPTRATASIATAEFFRTLGVPAQIGRPFTAAEDVPNGEAVVTLSDALWRRAFGADPAVVGSTILVDGEAARVTGVMPRGFDIDDAGVEIWLPAQLDPANRENRGSHYLNVVARLRDGVTIEQAKAELSSLVAQWEQMNPGTHVPRPENHPFYLNGLQDEMVGYLRPALILLLGAVGFVLLIACANVANLLLARAETRQKEIAVRAALGAGRRRLLRQFATEGVLLAGLGGAVGLTLGYTGLQTLLATSPGSIPRAGAIELDTSVLVFTLIVSVLTGVIFGLAPALHLGERTVTTALREGGHRATAGGARQRIRRLLVVSEIALAVVLVVGSGLMLRSFSALQEVDPGFDADNLLTFQLYVPPATYPEPQDVVAFYDRVLARIGAQPGVVATAAMSGLPPRRDVNANDTEFEGYEPGPDDPPENVDYWQFVTTDYLETMNIRVVSGRGFEMTDVGAGAPVVLINERLARTFYPDQNPLGRRLRPPFGDFPWLTIVGIVEDVKQGGLEEETGTEIYFHMPQLPAVAGFAPRTMNIVARTVREPITLGAAARRAVASLDPSLPIADLRSMDDVLHASVAQPRFLTLLLTIFAVVALSLAAIGTYGVMSYSVAERRQEIGVRMALGARADGVLRMVIGQGLAVAAVGLVIGMAGAVALTRLLSSLLFEISATDPLSLLAAPVVLGLVALLACYIPARRATRVDPVVALKQE